MALGALGRAHPFDILYDRVVRRLTGSPKLPASPNRRRLVFAIAAVWLGATAAAFGTGHLLLGYVLGGMISVMIVPLATVHVCLVSEPLELLVGPAKPPEEGI
jgi:hypothetical protein